MVRSCYDRAASLVLSNIDTQDASRCVVTRNREMIPDFCSQVMLACLIRNSAASNEFHQVLHLQSFAMSKLHSNLRCSVLSSSMNFDTAS